MSPGILVLTDRNDREWLELVLAPGHFKLPQRVHKGHDPHVRVHRVRDSHPVIDILERRRLLASQFVQQISGFHHGSVFVFYLWHFFD